MAYTTRVRTRDTRLPTHRTVHEVDTYWHRDETRNEGVSFTGTIETMSDNNNHSISWAARNNVIIMADCSLSRTTRSYTAGQTSAQSGTWTGTVTGDVTGSIIGMPNLPGDLTVDTNALLLQAYARMNESALVTGETIKDLGGTISMLRRPFKGAVELVGRMIKYRSARLGKTVASALRASSDAWLEYRHGWGPLILDANTVIKEIHRQRERCKVLRLVSRAGSSDQLVTDGSWSATAQQKCSGSYTLVRKLKCGVGVLYELKPRMTSEDVQRILGTRNRDLPATVWESVPLSFVADWFFPIGPWLQAITPDPFIEVRGHWATVVTERTLTRSGSQVKFSPSDWSGSCGSDAVTTVNYTRLCNQPLSSPFSSPTFKLSKIHQIDAVALLYQNITSGLKTLKH